MIHTTTSDKSKDIDGGNVIEQASQTEDATPEEGPEYTPSDIGIDLENEPHGPTCSNQEQEVDEPGGEQEIANTQQVVTTKQKHDKQSDMQEQSQSGG